MNNLSFVKENIITTKKSLVNLKTTLENINNDNNSNLETIKSNWQGKKSKSILLDIDKIIANSTQLLQKMDENIQYIDEVIKTYDIAENPMVEQTQQNNVTHIEPQKQEDIQTVLETTTPLKQEPSNMNVSGNIIDIGTTGDYSRVINFQGASWNLFNMRDPDFADIQLNRGNKKGWLPLARNGTHPFAAINVLSNSKDYVNGTKMEVVKDISAGFGTVKLTDTNTNQIQVIRNGFTLVNNPSGKTSLGSNRKFHSLIKDAGIETADLGSNINNAINALENGNLVHCISQENSTIAPSGHYMVIVGVEKNKSGESTALYLLDSLGRRQEDYDNMKYQNGQPVPQSLSSTIEVIEPGLMRVELTKEGIRGAKLASFRSGEGLESNNKTVFSFEEYKTNNK